MVENPLRSQGRGGTIVTFLAVAYAVAAILSGWNIIAHGTASTTAIEQILTTY